jgi:hypothetical protein
VKSYLGIITVAGSYRRVQELLRNAGFDACSVFGELDVICRGIDFTDISEYRSILDRVVSICGKLISRTHSLVLLSPQVTLPEKHPFAFILISVSIQLFDQILAQIRIMDEVSFAEVIIGPYDIICEVDVENLTQLEHVVTNILRVEGVQSTTTMICTVR